MPRYFTLEQAQALVPRMAESVQLAISLKTSIDESEQELRGESERIRMTGGALVHREKLVGTLQKREATAAQLREVLTAIQEHGCLVKDLDTGLLDFPTLFRDDEVYLCWRLGEDKIAFWHALSDGVRGRKPIDQEFLDNHRGEA